MHANVKPPALSRRASATAIGPTTPISITGQPNDGLGLFGNSTLKPIHATTIPDPNIQIHLRKYIEYLRGVFRAGTEPGIQQVTNEDFFLTLVFICIN